MSEPDFSRATFRVSQEKGEYVVDADLRFHIEKDDYFASLATVLGFIEEITLQHEGRGYPTGPLNSQSLRKLREDLIYLHQNYKILPKEGSK